MFGSAELNHDISKKVCRREEPKLRQALLEAQNELRRDGRFAVLVLIAGAEGAGKGETVNRLNEWMDPRYIESRIQVLETLCGAIEGALKRAGKKGEEGGRKRRTSSLLKNVPRLPKRHSRGGGNPLPPLGESRMGALDSRLRGSDESFSTAC